MVPRKKPEAGKNGNRAGVFPLRGNDLCNRSSVSHTLVVPIVMNVAARPASGLFGVVFFTGVRVCVPPKIHTYIGWASRGCESHGLFN